MELVPLASLDDLLQRTYMSPGSLSALSSKRLQNGRTCWSGASWGAGGGLSGDPAAGVAVGGEVSGFGSATCRLAVAAAAAACGSGGGGGAEEDDGSSGSGERSSWIVVSAIICSSSSSSSACESGEAGPSNSSSSLSSKTACSSLSRLSRPASEPLVVVVVVVPLPVVTRRNAAPVVAAPMEEGPMLIAELARRAAPGGGEKTRAGGGASPALDELAAALTRGLALLVVVDLPGDIDEVGGGGTSEVLRSAMVAVVELGRASFEGELARAGIVRAVVTLVGLAMREIPLAMGCETGAIDDRREAAAAEVEVLAALLPTLARERGRPAPAAVEGVTLLGGSGAVAAVLRAVLELLPVRAVREVGRVPDRAEGARAGRVAPAALLLELLWLLESERESAGDATLVLKPGAVVAAGACTRASSRSSSSSESPSSSSSCRSLTC